MTQFKPDTDRYDGRMEYRRCGRSGLLLPKISLGFWHNFGGTTTTEAQRNLAHTAFDSGITHFDLANNYGPPAGSAEINAGKIINELPRDELVVSSKAGYLMWPGPYGEWGSRKYLLASLNQSLRRLNLEYVDIFYSHRFDPETPLEETLGALQSAIDQGKALYTGISSYSTSQTKQAEEICRANGWSRILIHQPNYSMFNRWIENSLVDQCRDSGMGMITFCPLYQGLLTDKYLNGIPSGSRADACPSLLRTDDLAEPILDVVRQLNELAAAREQTLAQMAIAWNLRIPEVTSVLCGASSSAQILENCAALKNQSFSAEELKTIDTLTLNLKMPSSLWAKE